MIAPQTREFPWNVNLFKLSMMFFDSDEKFLLFKYQKAIKHF